MKTLKQFPLNMACLCTNRIVASSIYSGCGLLSILVCLYSYDVISAQYHNWFAFLRFNILSSLRPFLDFSKILQKYFYSWVPLVVIWVKDPCSCVLTFAEFSFLKRIRVKNWIHQKRRLLTIIVCCFLMIYGTLQNKMFIFTYLSILLLFTSFINF